MAISPRYRSRSASTNAGMYHPDYRPVGLYIENGRELAKKAKTRQAISRTQCGVGPEDFPITVSRIAK